VLRSQLSPGTLEYDVYRYRTQKIIEVIIRKASTRVEMRVCQCTRFSLGSRWHVLSSLKRDGSAFLFEARSPRFDASLRHVFFRDVSTRLVARLG